MEKFAVKSESFALYEAFKKDVEAIGWKYNSSFNEFVRDNTAHNNCLYFSNQWDDFNGLGFSISTSNDGIIFHLESQYGEALAFAKEVWDKEHKFTFGFSGTCSIGVNCPLNGTWVVNDTTLMPTPKFKVGEWVRASNGDVFQIDRIYLGSYIRNKSDNNQWKKQYAEHVLEKWIPKKGEYISVIFDFEKPIRRYVCIVKEELGQIFTPYAGLDAADNLIMGGTFGYYDGNIASPATPSEIALLDTKLAEQGKRFDKEKCELVDIPKHKEPIVGEMAIFWDEDKNRAIVAEFIERTSSYFYPFKAVSLIKYANAILFESPEQYKAFLKS